MNNIQFLNKGTLMVQNEFQFLSMAINYYSKDGEDVVSKSARAYYDLYKDLQKRWEALFFARTSDARNEATLAHYANLCLTQARLMLSAELVASQEVEFDDYVELLEWYLLKANDIRKVG